MVLCGRDGVQLASRGPADLIAIAASLGAAVQSANPWLLRWQDGELQATLFADGRVIVQGTQDPLRALSLRDRWLA